MAPVFSTNTGVFTYAGRNAWTSYGPVKVDFAVVSGGARETYGILRGDATQVRSRRAYGLYDDNTTKRTRTSHTG